MKQRSLSRIWICLLLVICITATTFMPVLAAGMSYDVIISPRYEAARSFSESLAAVKKNGKWGFIDQSGKTVIPFEYDYAFDFSEGLAVVGKRAKVEAYAHDDQGVYDLRTVDGYLWYIIDKDNNRKPLMRENNTQAYKACVYFDESQSPTVYFHNGYVNMSGYLTSVDYEPDCVFDRDGNAVYLSHVESVEGCFNEGLFAGYILGNPSAYFVDKNGETVLSFEDGEDHYIRPFNQGLAPHGIYDYETDRTNWGFVDKNGKTVIGYKYANFYVSGLFSTYQVFNDGIASMQDHSGKWGGIDKTGKTVIPFEYEVLGVFTEGVACACKNGKYGVINTKNQVVVPFTFDRITSYSDGRAVAVKDGRAFCIDRYGNEIAGSNTVSQETYFPEGLDSLRLLTPADIITIQDGTKYGFAQIGYTPDPPKQGELADWAYAEVIEAIDHDLIPADLQNQYLVEITRADFSTLIVNLLTVVTGKDIDEIVREELGKELDDLVAAYPFTDTTSRDVIAANALGLINGRGNGIFDPYNKLTRQEAAALLMRLAKYMGRTDVDASQVNFADAASVQSYAKEAVAYVKALGVMNGTSATTFSPYGTYTRQQAYMTIWRLYNAVTAE